MTKSTLLWKLFKSWLPHFNNQGFTKASFTAATLQSDRNFTAAKMHPDVALPRDSCGVLTRKRHSKGVNSFGRYLLSHIWSITPIILKNLNTFQNLLLFWQNFNCTLQDCDCLKNKIEILLIFIQQQFSGFPIDLMHLWNEIKDLQSYFTSSNFPWACKAFALWTKALTHLGSI